MEKVVVAGAGAIGLTAALELAGRGLDVTVRDPAPLGDNASGVAAGMLAPAFEAALDPVSASHFELLCAARDLWPDLAARAGIEIDRSGARYVGGEPEAVTGRLGGLFTPQDWRLRPAPALAALRAACEAAGVRFEASRAEPSADAVTVLATGAAPGPAPELAHLTPIKGHILRFAGGPAEGPVLRGDGVYVCPDRDGAAAGATMEPGRGDRAVDPDIAAELAQAAVAICPALEGLAWRAFAGVRAATPDGLPMVGWSARPGLLLAVGARRNGWLLAPLVARMAGAYLQGQDPGAFCAELDPRRFERGRP